jgi:hypothetical protein
MDATGAGRQVWCRWCKPARVRQAIEHLSRLPRGRAGRRPNLTIITGAQAHASYGGSPGQIEAKGISIAKRPAKSALSTQARK